MVKLQKCQMLAKVAVVALFFLITPLSSTSMRSSYLYVLCNLIIIALGVESGFFLSAFSRLPDDKKTVVDECPSNMDSGTSSSVDRAPESESFHDGSFKTVEKQPTSSVNKSPSKPSLFFVGGGDLEEEEEEDHVEEEEVEVLSRQELFVKAETFIGNFYRQLKIQREESWKKIHGLYRGGF
ncbi:hypothetical protein ACLOJK_011034 [Asimina triloba]